MADVGERTGSGIALPAEVVAALPWEANDWGGVSRLLWEDRATGSIAGLIALSPGEAHHRHAHQDLTHHVWVLSGTIRVGNEWLARGSYTCTPAGLAHGPEIAGPEGCELFYVLVPTR